MISAIVLGSECQTGEEIGHAHEIVVRSLVWLVSAVVAGVVRDVVLAVPPGFGLSEVAEQSGCGLVQADEEAARLAAAVAMARCSRLLFLKAGYQPDGHLADEIDSFVRRAPAESSALIFAAPETAAQRLLPGRAPVIGVLVTRALCAELQPKSFDRLVRAVRGASRLRARALRIV